MAYTVVDALRNVGTDRAAITNYINTVQKFDGVQGVHFDRSTGNAYGVTPDQMIIATIRDGKFVYAGHSTVRTPDSISTIASRILNAPLWNSRIALNSNDFKRIAVFG